MTLGDWLKSRNMTHDDLARRLGCDRSAVTKWVGGRLPRKDVLRRLKEITDGSVTADDFLESEDESPQSIELPRAS